VLHNPEIVKLAPFSTSLVTGKKCVSHSKLVPASHAITPVGGPSCLKTIAERKTILKEIQNLSEALITQQNKFELAVERIKDERKKHKKTKKNLEKSELKKDLIEYLKRRIEDLKRNEENLLQDLVQQQSISKDALQGLDNLRVKFDEEKKMMKDELEHYYTLLVEQEKCKYHNLLQKFNQLEPLEKQVKDLEAKNHTLERRLNEQREATHNFQNMLEDSKNTARMLEDKLEDKTAQLDLKEKEFKSVVGELKHQLEDLGK
jgi:septal ring factor EnvC (AmiA/AmiB activator)